MEEGHTCSGSEAQQAFYYDGSDNTCKAFVYNGCGGNLNKFWSEQRCKRRCVEEDDTDVVRPTPRPRRRNCRRPVCRMSCPFGFVKDEIGCVVCQCMKQEESNCPSSDRCGNFCPHGRQINPRSGCERCSCRWPVEDESSLSSSESTESDSYDSDYIGSVESDSAESSDDAEIIPTEPPYPGHCSRKICAMLCQYGFVRDDNGCPICQCRKDPALQEEEEEFIPEPQTFPEVCKNRPMCLMFCRNGYEVDQDGCPKCSCRQNPSDEQNDREHEDPTQPPHVVCPPFRCDEECPFGYKQSHNGCPQCTCRTSDPTRPREEELDEHSEGAECPRRHCRIRCRFGFASDENGCELCQCLPPPDASRPPAPAPVRCRPMQCGHICQHGHVKDQHGCPTCDCSNPQEVKPTACLHPRCLIVCQSGYVEGPDGCPTCQCKESQLEHGESDPIACQSVACLNRCPFGRILDNNGCETCSCKPAPEPQPCRQIYCLIFCPTGYMRDENGCQTCHCNPSPSVDDDDEPILVQDGARSQIERVQLSDGEEREFQEEEQQEIVRSSLTLPALKNTGES